MSAQLTRFHRTLRSRRARLIPPALVIDLLATADALRADLQALRRTVACPEDASLPEQLDKHRNTAEHARGMATPVSTRSAARTRG